MRNKKKYAKCLWEAWCLASIVGIWPRHVEPRLIATHRLQVPVAHLPAGLKGITIAQISDLHFHAGTSLAFLKKITHKIAELSPDIIVFTGDFLCSSRLENPDILRDFLCSLRAPYGCFASLGNHDYAEYVSINVEGDYDLVESDLTPLEKGLKKLFCRSPILTGRVSERAKKIPLHKELVALLKGAGFHLLHNQTEIIKIGDAKLNLCGLGEYTLGRCQPEQAFQGYDERFPGIVLTHNPDSLPRLESYPWNIALCGHTHGGQINLPFIRNKFIQMENQRFRSGLYRVHNRLAYVNRGLGSSFYFRWFAMPEITLFRLI